MPSNLALAVLLVPVLALGAARAQDRSACPVQVEGPPPAWITPCLRLTYATLVGSLPDTDYVYEAEEGGRWVDEQGNRYHRREVAAQGSRGLLQADVVALAADQAAVALRFYLFDGHEDRAPLLCLESGFVAPSNTGGDLWVHPEALRQVLAKGADGLTCRQVRHQIELATYDALLLVSQRANGRSVWIYDLASGVLLFASDVTDVAGQRSQTGVDVQAGCLQVRFTTFQGSRTLALPWASQDASPPAALEAARYRGSFSVRQPGLAETPLPFELGFSLVQRGPGYVLLVPQAGPVSAALERRVVGAHQLGGGWLPPRGLAQLRAGQELDVDPLTRVTTRVERVDAQHVVLVQESPRQRSELVYARADGLLERAVAEERLAAVPGMSKVVELELDRAAPR